MRAATLLTLALPLLLAPAPAVAGDRDDEARDREFVGRVNDAIDRGVLWLVKQQRADGSWAGYEKRYPMGTTALCFLTVLKCDYPRKSSAVKKAKNLLFERYKDQRSDRLRTYSVAILMMALEEAYAPREQEDRKKDRYGGRHSRRVILPNADLKWMAELARWMVRTQTDSVWRYPGGGIDHSNTQYALLGLAAARRCGIPVSRNVFLKAATHLLDAQEATGPEVRRIVHVDQGEGYARRYLTNMVDRARGWGYVPGRPATGSMTTAGVSSLAICRSELLDWSGYKALAPRLERGIKDGLAWLTKNFAVDRNPPGRGGWHYYYLFGLERAGVLADVRFLGDHDWYRKGALYLLSRQSPAGFWRGGNAQATITDTCFALLFLRRATVPVRVPRAVTPRPEEAPDREEVERR